MNTPLSREACRALIQHRAHIAPKRLIAPGPSEFDLNELFEAAACAPDHGRINPWRFILVTPDAREKLAQAFVAALLERDPHVQASDLERAREKAHRSPCLMLAVVNSQPHLTSEQAEHPSVIGLDERLISLGCAIQNMLLLAQAQGWGSGITSGQALKSQALRALFSLDEQEQAICFINLGTVDKAKPPRQRPPIRQFVSSI